MKVSVIISSYNYEKFVLDAVKSVLNQSYSDIETIFVDDGSSDNTVKLVRSLSSRIVIIEKRNGGQLSAFNAAFPYINGDIVFFIDADDIYGRDYIKNAVDFYISHEDADFVFSGINYFGTADRRNVVRITKCFGFTLCQAWYFKSWIGAATSAISMRIDILNKILPLDIESDWRVRADDCLVWGASLVGAKKYSLADNAVNYRVHGNNCHYGKGFDAGYLFRRSLAINRLFGLLAAKNQIVIDHEVVRFEYLSQPDRNLRKLILYFRIIFKTEESLLKKLISSAKIARLFFKRMKGL